MRIWIERKALLCIGAFLSLGFAAGAMATVLVVQQPSQTKASPPSGPVSDNSQSNIVVALGDSVTAGYGVPPGKSYPDFLEQYLYESGYPYNVINFGRNGATSADCVKLLGSVEKRKPALVIVIVGANDALRGISILQTSANLEQIVSSLQSSGSKVILGEQTLSEDYGAGYIQQFHAMFASLAQQYNIPLDSDLYRDLTNVPGMLQDDGVHPTADGDAQFARNLLPLVQAALIKHHRTKRHH